MSDNPNLPSETERVSAQQIRRNISSPSGMISNALSRQSTARIIIISMVVSIFILPMAWIFAPPMTAFYILWLFAGRNNLPYRNPASWGGVDYTAPHPGIDGKFDKSKGILSLGVTGMVGQVSRGRELWITNDDARRHMAMFGTTGSGKALPLDTLILTPHGFVENGDLRPGDKVCHPDGGLSTVKSVHPQGDVPAVRIWLSDGRFLDCSRDHLWTIVQKPRKGYSDFLDGLTKKARSKENIFFHEGSDLKELSNMSATRRTMEACDLGIFHGAQASVDSPQHVYDLLIPRVTPQNGPFPALDVFLAYAAGASLTGMDLHPEFHGTPGDRRSFLSAFLSRRDGTCVKSGHICVPVRSKQEAWVLKSLIWSLSGDASSWEEEDGLFVYAALPGAGDLFEGAGSCTPDPDGILISGVEALSDHKEMSCIHIDRVDGLYIAEKYIVTHNTELLLGLAVQSLTWSSGFLFIDGKGTRVFYNRIWSLAKQFGREDDVRVVNFMGVEDSDKPSGGPDSQTNTMNPFARGTSDSLMNLVVSLMGDAGGGNDMWKNRAITLVSSAMAALCEMRDSGDLLLSVQAIRDYLPLGEGFRKSALGMKAGKIERIEEVPEEAWDELRTRSGMTELYLRALNGEFSTRSKLALKGFFDSLPGFSLNSVLNGKPIESKASEQYGFLSMQLTKPLGSLADDFGHIFNTPIGEVDIEDVVLNRRILIALLPALQKAPEEMQNCGKIIVSMTKMMMGKTSGATLQGGYAETIGSDPTRAPSPFICVFDEVGYYFVAGIDVMMAQARSLGFMIILAGQDMSAMQKVSPQLAETALANASTLAVGKTTDATKTMEYISKVVGEEREAVSSGYTGKAGFFGTKYMDKMDVTIQDRARLKIRDVQNMAPGQFYFLFEGKLELARTFYVGETWAQNFSVNKFIKIRGPLDRAPGLDNSVEEEFLKGVFDTARYIGGHQKASLALLESQGKGQDGLDKKSIHQDEEPDFEEDDLSLEVKTLIDSAARISFLTKLAGERISQPGVRPSVIMASLKSMIESSGAAISSAELSLSKMGSSQDDEADRDVEDLLSSLDVDAENGGDSPPERDEWNDWDDEIKPEDITKSLKEAEVKSLPKEDYTDVISSITGRTGSVSMTEDVISSVAKAQSPRARYPGILGTLVAEGEARHKAAIDAEDEKEIAGLQEDKRRREELEIFQDIRSGIARIGHLFMEDIINKDVGGDTTSLRKSSTLMAGSPATNASWKAGSDLFSKLVGELETNT